MLLSYIQSTEKKGIFTVQLETIIPDAAIHFRAGAAKRAEEKLNFRREGGVRINCRPERTTWRVHPFLRSIAACHLQRASKKVSARGRGSNGTAKEPAMAERVCINSFLRNPFVVHAGSPIIREDLGGGGL